MTVNSTIGGPIQRLAIEHRPLEQLKPNPLNPRTHSRKQKKKIAASIREFGFLIPPLVDAEGQIIAGHARYEAAKYLGLSEVPTIRADWLTPAQLRAFMIADNRLSEEASWNNQVLAEHLVALEIEGFDAELTGFEVRRLTSSSMRLEERTWPKIRCRHRSLIGIRFPSQAMSGS